MDLYTLPLEPKLLKELLKQARHYNVAPIYLPQYILDPRKKSHPITSLLSKLVQEARDYLSISEAQEIRHLYECMPSSFQRRISPQIQTSEQRSTFALFCVCSEVQRNYFSFRGVIHPSLEDSEVLKIYPELREKIDKDGLLHLDSNFTLMDGGIEYKDHVLHYHQFLRRGYTSHPNFDFLRFFLSYYYSFFADPPTARKDSVPILKLVAQTKSKSSLKAKLKTENHFRIAIDHRRIMPKNFYAQIGEFDTWRGLPFDKGKLDDPNYVGLTVVERNKESLFEETCSLDRTEFYWSYRDKIKTFEVEEISSSSRIYDSYYLNRYIHSEREIENSKFRHLDGAVKVYLKDQFTDRHSSFMPKELKSYSKIKLWRIDGDILFPAWSELISLFFKGNEMILKYFNPDKFEAVFDLRVRDFPEWQRQQAIKKTE